MTIITGTSTGETLVGSSGNDVIRALAGDDYVSGDLGDDLILGGDGSSTTGTGNDTLDGGGGDDRIDGGDGNDLLIGGAGIDEAIYNYAQVGVVVDLLNGTASDGSGGTDILDTIENVSGSVFGDSMTGDAGDNSFRGLRGNDTINGGAGNDWVRYDKDYIFSGIAGVTVNLGAGTAIDGFGNTDTLTGIENASGTAANDVLNGDGGANILMGQIGDDTLDGGAGNDTLIGGTGVDTVILSGQQGDYVFTGTSTNFTAFDSTNPGAGTDTLQGIEFVRFGNGPAISVTTLGLPVGNNPPTGGGQVDLGAIAEDGSRIITVAELLAGSSDDDNDPLSIVNLTASSGTVTNNGNGTWTYVPAANDDSFVNFTYSISDGQASVPQVATLDLTSVNDAPVGGADTVGGLARQVLTLSAAALLGNDSDIDTPAGNLTIGAVQNGTNGTVVLNANGTVSFTPAAGFLGAATFFYRAYDGADLGAPTLVTVNVANSGVVLTGNGLANTLAGTALDDSLSGMGGNDTLLGGPGWDTLDGGTGNDSMSGSAGDDIFYVDSLGDVVVEVDPSAATGGIDMVVSSLASYTLGANVENGRISAAGTAELNGNALNNLLIAGIGDNIIRGGQGVDTVSYETGPAGVTVDLNLVTAQATGGSGSDTLVNIENLTGSGFNDVLTGNAGANLLQGGNGDDTLVGGLGNDVLDGGLGNDRLDGGTGSDTASYASAQGAVTVDLGIAGAQNTVNAGTDTLVGIVNLIGSGFGDTLTAGVAAHLLQGGAGNDTLTGGGNDTLDGGVGDDDLHGGRMVGGNGNDIYHVTNALDVVVETNTVAATGGIDRVVSTMAAYTLTANVEEGEIASAGTAELNGNASNNLLIAGAGDNLIRGGQGVDTVSYANATSAVTVNLNLVAAQATGGSGNDTLVNIENLAGSGFNDRLTGNSGANELVGGAGNDTLTGGLGNDVLNGGLGNDRLAGGVGSDYAIYADATASVTIDLGILTAQNTGGGGTDTLVDIEWVAGSNFSDTLTGDAFDNYLNGLAGNDVLISGDGFDTLHGGAGADVLDGGVGIDRMAGGDGSDRYVVNNSLDQVIETNANAATGGIDLVVSYSTAHTLTANVEIGQIAATGAANLTGNALSNHLIAGAGNNVIDGGTGVDTVSYASATSAVTVRLALTTAQATGGSGTDTLLSIENVTGSIFDDTLVGGGTGNVINGGAGDDVIYGRGGIDILDGGAGHDSFVFDALLLATNADTIQSFNVADDTIMLENTGIFSALVATGTLSAGAFNTGAAATEADDRIVYDTSNGALYYDADGSGAGAAVRFATLTGVIGTLTEADFFVY